MRRVAPGEAALHARVAVVRLPVLERHHAHHFVALQLGLEGAAHAAVGAGRDHAALGLPHFDDRLFHQRVGRAGLDAGAAGDALRIHEQHVAGRDLRGEAAAADGQRERALDFLAGAHAARADDALRRVEAEVRVRFVLGVVKMVGARRSRTALRAGPPRPPCPAARSRPFAGQVRQSSGWSEM